MKMKLSLLVLSSFTISSFAQEITSSQTLWYTSPAKNWDSEALHIGNGYMGGSFYGAPDKEIIDIAEKTFWSGGPNVYNKFNHGIIEGGKDKIDEIRSLILQNNISAADSLCRIYFVGDFTSYGAFSTVGKLNINFKNQQPVTEYTRGLDLQNSYGFVNYKNGTANVSRKYFCSYPDKALVLRLTSDKPTLSFSISHDLTYKATTTDISDNEITYLGTITDNGLNYAIRIKIINEDGTATKTATSIGVDNTTAATIVYSIDTEYDAYNPPLYKGVNPESTTKKTISYCTKKGYNALKSTHETDYKNLYDRVKLDITGDKLLETLPTDLRVKQLQSGMTDDSQLHTMFFNLSRYLLISASRQGTLPSTLQGVWNSKKEAPWSGNYQSNINLQEMYWGAGPTNLPECEEAYIEWIERLVEPGRKTAEAYYGTSGWVSHAVGNIWHYTSLGTDIKWGIYPSGAAWHCKHLWDHYQYTSDKEYLKRVYPIIKEASEFWLQNMVKYKEHYIISPSITAEHGVETEKDSYHKEYWIHNGEVDSSKIYTTPAYQDIEMVHELYDFTIKAANILNIDEQFIEKVKVADKKLLPLQIGRYGQLQEWIYDYDNPRDHHRHLSHLFGLYPGTMFSMHKNKEYAEAARVSLNMRGEGNIFDRWFYTGGNWSMAWRVALWAKLYDGERAINIYNRMIKEVGFPNMMSSQVGNMQVDASMATSALFALMLIQSEDDTINLLPALPVQWPEGEIKGIVTHRGDIVDIAWKYNKLQSAIIKLGKGNIFPKILIKGHVADTNNNIKIIK